jgi:hypothetical protein
MRNYVKVLSAVDPDLLPVIKVLFCGPALVSMRIRIQILTQCGSGPGSREPTQCGSMRILVLVRLLSHKKLKFYMKNVLKVVNRSKDIHSKVQKHF